MNRRADVVEALWAMAQHLEYKEPSMRVAFAAGFLESAHAEEDEEVFRLGSLTAILERGWSDGRWPDDKETLADVLRVLYFVLAPYISDPELKMADLRASGEEVMSRIDSLCSDCGGSCKNVEPPRGVRVHESSNGGVFVVMDDPTCDLAQMVGGLAGIGATNINGVVTNGGADEKANPRLLATAFGIESVGHIEGAPGAVICMANRERADELLRAFGYPTGDDE